MKKKENITYIDFKKWNSKVITVSVKVLAVCFIIEAVLFLLFKPTSIISKEYYFLHFVILPTLFQGLTIVFLIFVSKILIKIFNEHVISILMIIGEVTFVLISVVVHSSVPFMCASLFYPIIFTYVYKDKFYCYFACFISALGYSLVILDIIPSTQYKPVNTPITYLIIFIILILLTAFCTLAMKVINIEFDQTEKKLKEKASEMKYAAEVDSLTGLYNHNTFYKKINYYLENNIANKIYLLVIDIDNFKIINDTYGHIAGDHVIEAVSLIIKDTLNIDDFASRYGGEEFVAVYNNINEKKAFSLANKIREECINSIIYYKPGVKISYTVSIGICAYNYNIKTGKDFFECADKALYQAKRSGKNRSILYTH